MKITIRRVTIPVLTILAVLILLTIVIMLTAPLWRTEYARSMVSCPRMVFDDYLSVSTRREHRFLGKVREDRALSVVAIKPLITATPPGRIGQITGAQGTPTPWAPTRPTGRILSPTERGITGALMDLEFQRIGLIKYNLFDNYTYKGFLEGEGKFQGRAIKVWDEMRLPADHPNYEDVGGGGVQMCDGGLIRHRTLTGICNDTLNPLMGSTNTLFARNVQFDTSFPRLGQDEMNRNRHGDRLGLLKPDPQLISRRLFTRQQSNPESCGNGYGGEDPANTDCDYIKAPFFNVLAAFWIQFMNHDWFSHLEEGHNQDEYMKVGCDSSEAAALGCRAGDRMEKAYVADDSQPGKFTYEGEEYLERAPRTFRNTNTAWWDASQLYGYDELSQKRVKRDPTDPAKLLMLPRGDLTGEGDDQGYLPILAESDPMNPAWAGQAATGFPDNWTIGMSFYHNVFAREHNAFVEGFRKKIRDFPEDGFGLAQSGTASRCHQLRRCQR